MLIHSKNITSCPKNVVYSTISFTSVLQPMVSFVQRSRLGGKFPDLGPNEVHPFEPFKKELFEFNDLMDKAQELVEEVKDGEAFAQKICQCFKSHIAKSCAAGKVNQVENNTLRSF